MTSRLKISDNKTRKETSPLSNTPIRGMFESHPFAVQPKSNHHVQQPNLKTSLIQAQKYGHHLSQTNLVNQSAAVEEPVQLAAAGKRKRSPSSSDDMGGGKRHQPSGKQKQLEELAKAQPNKTPMQILKENPNLLVGKKDPFLTGEHSPSAVNYNKATDNHVAVLGRDHSKLKAGKSVDLAIKEDKIPTFQFRNTSGKPIVPGKEAHSITTSLRAAAGVGEHTSQPLDDTLDKTLNAYRGPVTLLSNPNQNMKVDVYNKGAKSSLLRHPVHPRIAQAAINMWVRGSVAQGQPRKQVL